MILVVLAIELVVDAGAGAGAASAAGVGVEAWIGLLQKIQLWDREDAAGFVAVGLGQSCEPSERRRL